MNLDKLFFFLFVTSFWLHLKVIYNHENYDTLRFIWNASEWEWTVIRPFTFFLLFLAAAKDRSLPSTPNSDDHQSSNRPSIFRHDKKFDVPLKDCVKTLQNAWDPLFFKKIFMAAFWIPCIWKWGSYSRQPFYSSFWLVCYTNKGVV